MRGRCSVDGKLLAISLLLWKLAAGPRVLPDKEIVEHWLRAFEERGLLERQEVEEVRKTISRVEDAIKEKRIKPLDYGTLFDVFEAALRG